VISATVRYVPAAVNVLIAVNVYVKIAIATVAILKDASAKNAHTAINAAYAKTANVDSVLMKTAPARYAITAISVQYAAPASAVRKAAVMVRYAEKAAAPNV